MEWINDNVFVVSGKTGGHAVAVELTSRDQYFGPTAFSTGAGSVPGSVEGHIPWGSGDDQPNVMGQLIQKNSQIGSLLEAQRDMIYGSGLAFFKRIYEPDPTGKMITRLEPFIDSKLTDWAYATELTDYVIAAINERMQNANHFTRFEFTPDGIPLINIADAHHTRKGRDCKHYHHNPYFGDRMLMRSTQSEIIPMFNRLDPKSNVVSILQSREHKSGNPHYAYPSWWCSKDSIELANLVVAFHKSGITNGYNLKYVIKVPFDYFDRRNGKSVPENERAKLWADWADNLSNWLSGVKNVNKALITKFARAEDGSGKGVEGVSVEPIKNEMSDDAYARVWEMSNVAISNASGILPVLGGVTPGSKSGDSGSQIRVVADYQQHYRTPVHRHIITQPIEQALRILGYTDVVPVFQDVQLTTLDVNKSGSEPVINKNA